MKRKTAALTLIMALLASTIARLLLVNSATSNSYLPTYLPKITINGDGNITPETGYISRAGNVYTLTADIITEYSIVILCSNIIFDGAGHPINISKSDNSGLGTKSVTNVKVKNLEIISLYGGAMVLTACSNCTLAGIKSGDTFVHLGELLF